MITLNPNPAYIIIGSMNGFLAYHYKANIPQYDANIILFKKANILIAIEARAYTIP